MKKFLSLLTAFAFIMTSCFMTAFAANATIAGDTTLTIRSNKPDREYNLYQIFYGKHETVEGKTDKTLTALEWGESIKTSDYDLSSDLITALKAEKLADGSTNPIASQFSTLTASSTAEDVASKLKGITNDSENADALAAIVGDVIKAAMADGKSIVKKVNNAYSNQDETDQEYEYIFSNIHDGYYLVYESTKENPSDSETYTKYILKVAGATVTETKADNAPSLEKEIVVVGTKALDYEVRLGKLLSESSNVLPQSAEDELTDWSTISSYATSRFGSASIGDNVIFKLTSTVPAMEAYTKYHFIVHDTMSKGLTYDQVKEITVGDTEVVNKSLLAENSTETRWFEATSTVNSDGTTDLKVVFNNFKQYSAGSKITIYYIAKLNEDAVVGTSSENLNKARLQYSNDPNYDYSGENEPTSSEPSGYTPWSTVYVYTTGINLFKVDEYGARLAGAKFRIEGTGVNTVISEGIDYVPKSYSGIYGGTATSAAAGYYKLADGSYTTTAPTGVDSKYEAVYVMYNKTTEGETDTYTADVDGVYYHNTATDTYTSDFEDSQSANYEVDYVVYEKSELSSSMTKTADYTYEGTVDSNGYLPIYGLGEGTYKITEIIAPSGYNILKNPITVMISFTKPQAGAIEKGATWTFYVDKSGGTNYTTSKSPATGIYDLSIENQSGATLPTTGGIGTKIFYAIGSILLIGAAVLLITKRRMLRENN
jgi:fimbrial isopeptide formation D2 family protein/LPXTG-motif cell wall-anchored protein